MTTRFTAAEIVGTLYDTKEPVPHANPLFRLFGLKAGEKQATLGYALHRLEDNGMTATDIQHIKGLFYGMVVGTLGNQAGWIGDIDDVRVGGPGTEKYRKDFEAHLEKIIDQYANAFVKRPTLTA
jgi:hypothetical protein